MTSEAAFRLLRVGQVRSSNYSVRDTGLEWGQRPVQHGIDPLGLPCLLFPLSAAEPDAFDDESLGIRVDTVVLPEYGSVRYGILRCERPDLEPQFALLVDDVLRALKSDLSTPGETSIAVLARWRLLFELGRGSLLSKAAQIGLLAELHVLESLVHLVGDAALLQWTGPEGNRHDFTGVVGAIEVKATLTRDTFPIAIHGSWQLEKPSDGDLLIYAEQFEVNPTGESLPDVVARIIGTTTKVQIFLEKLRGVGYFVGDSVIYESFRYSRLQTRLCLVDEAFPRLTRDTVEGSVLAGISQLKYSVDVGLRPQVVPSEGALNEAVSRLANDA